MAMRPDMGTKPDIGWLMRQMAGGGAKNAPFPEPVGDPTPRGNNGIGAMGAPSAPPGAGYPYGKGGSGPMTRPGGGRMSPGGGPMPVSPMDPTAAGGGMQNEGALRGRRAQLEQKRQALMARIANLTRQMGMYQGEAAAGNPSAQGYIQQIQSQIEAVTIQIQQVETEMQQLERDFQEMQAQEQQQQGPGGVRSTSNPGVPGSREMDPFSNARPFFNYSGGGGGGGLAPDSSYYDQTPMYGTGPNPGTIRGTGRDPWTGIDIMGGGGSNPWGFAD